MIVHDFPLAAEGDLRSTDFVGIVNLHGSIGLHQINAATGARVAIPDPPDVIRWPRMTPAGPIRVCGQSQGGDRAAPRAGGAGSSGSFEWDGAATWTATGPAHGASPTIYDGLNVLHIIRPAADMTVNGYRCLDAAGRPVLGEATIAIATVPGGRLLHKYTPIETPAGMVLIGQDDVSGVHVVFQDRRYILDAGVVDFIRAAWSPDRGLAVLVTHYDQSLVRTFLFGLDEIAGLEEFRPPIDPPVDPVAPPKFTIASPTFPQAGTVPFDLRCVYADEPGGGPLEWIEWLIGPSAGGPWTLSAHNPGADPDHTYHFTTAGIAYVKARGGNAAGTHETGATRQVTATAPIDPPPIDPIPAATFYRLGTVHGGEIMIGADRVLHEGPQGALFEIVPSMTAGRIGLRSGGAYVAAEPDGRLICNRGSIGEWEEFVQTKSTHAGANVWRFQSAWLARYMSAHDDGTVRADQPVADAWESFTPIPVTDPGGPVSRWHVDRWLFRDAANAAVRVMGFTGFQVLRLLADGVSVDPLLWYFRAKFANLIRCWAYLPKGHPIAGGWEPPTTAQLIAGIETLRSWGLTTYLTLLTDDDPARIPWAQTLVRDLGAAGLESLILEIGNEPSINKAINTEALRAACDASGLLYTSGEYADSAKWFGSFGDAHTPRDLEWPRKAHDLHEYQVGGGPSYPTEPACPVPWISGEPIKPTEAPDGQTDPSTGTTIHKTEDYLAYGAACGLLGAGGIFHYEGGKTGQLPIGDEEACCTNFFAGLQAFPAEMFGPSSYVRIDEHGATLRTYAKGPYTVRIRPQSGPILITG
jgi:hypothetical protein